MHAELLTSISVPEPLSRFQVSPTWKTQEEQSVSYQTPGELPSTKYWFWPTRWPSATIRVWIKRLSSSREQLLQALEELRREGIIKWSGKYLEPREPVARVRGEGTVAELIVNDRR